MELTGWFHQADISQLLLRSLLTRSSLMRREKQSRLVLELKEEAGTIRKPLAKKDAG